MKKRSVAILLMVFVLMITGCGNSNNAEKPNGADSQIMDNTDQTDTDTIPPLDGVTMEVIENSDTSVTVKITNNTDKNIECGEDFCLKILDEETGEWRDLNTVIDDYGFNAVAYIIQKDLPYETVINFEWLYGKLKPGRYRIVKTVMDFRGTGDYTSYAFAAEFDISMKEAADENTITFDGVIIDNTVDTLEPTICVKPLQNEIPYDAVFFELPDNEVEWASQINSVVTVTCADTFTEQIPHYGTLISIVGLTTEADNSLAPFTEEQIEEAKQAALAYYSDTVFTVNGIKYFDGIVPYGNSEDCCNFTVNVSKDSVVQEPDRTISLQLNNGIWEVVNEGY